MATDTQRSREKASVVFAPLLTSPTSSIKFFQTFLISNNVKGVQAAFTELLILSECDVKFLSGSSSYSEQAMAIR